MCKCTIHSLSHTELNVFFTYTQYNMANDFLVEFSIQIFYNLLHIIIVSNTKKDKSLKNMKTYFTYTTCCYMGPNNYGNKTRTKRRVVRMKEQA